MASAYLSRTLGTPTLNTKYTFSVWVKRSTPSSAHTLIGGSSSAPDTFIINSNNKLTYYANDGSSASISTTRLLRDTSAFYHLVLAVDTTQSTASDRVKMYINGTLQTAFDTSTYPAQNYANKLNSAVPHRIGENPSSDSETFDGLMTHIHFIDGTQYQASDFGETDSTSGIWKPKTSPSVTYGTNGFFLKMENSSDMGEDSSGNNNDFTTSGTITQTEDTPSNNFATWNPVSNPRIASGTVYLPTFSNGNTTANHPDVNYYTNTKSSLGVSSGKWYFEAKCSAVGSQAYIGLASDDDYGELDRTCLYENNGNFDGSAYGNTYTAGDILQIAFDADNGTLWFGKNGTWQNSATQSEIENGTTTNSAITSLDMTKFWHFATKGYNGAIWQANFGNGYFGTTAVASSNSDSAGLGLFEYSVPSGYYALCTKNIKNYG